MSRFVRIACENCRCPSFNYISCPGHRAYRTYRAGRRHARPVYAGDSDQQVKTVRVGWLVSNRGFQEGTPGERLSGWGYEYLQTLSYYTPGWQYEYVSGTFTELMDKLEAGEIDLMPNISYSEERAQKLLFSSNPEGTERYYIYARPDRDDLAKGDPQALQGLTIGYNPGAMQTFVGQQWLANEGITCTYKEIKHRWRPL